MATRTAYVLTALALMVTACASTSSRPAEFENMSADEVGCTVNHGNTDLYAVGPLGPSNSEEVTPNDYTSIRVGRTASDIVVVATVPGGKGNAATPLNNMPADGVVARRGFSNGGDPGYVVRCWQGGG